MRQTTKPRPEQWQRVTKNSHSQFMRTRERPLWVSTHYVNVPGMGFVRMGKGQTAIRSKS